MSAFYVWNPNVNEDDRKVLEFVITNGDVVEGVFNNQGFFNRILGDLGLEGSVASWTIRPLRSKYYSDYPDEEEWLDAWPIVWKVRVVGKNKFGEIQEFETMWIGTNATGEELSDGPDDDEAAGCLVVCDFDQKQSLKEARKLIRNDETVARMQEKYSVGEPEFTSFRVLDQYYQLQIELGEFEAEFFENGADYAEHVMSLCEQAGGTTHFGERE